ncbi:MAG: VCBS repeat-containing protein [Saprospiraceae bacterium]|nr:VCBS repeat-containing protein [Saprospiraceae bacterium]
MKYLPFFITAALCLLFLFFQCGENQSPNDGEALAKANCTPCHAYPSPELLDRATWQKYILPRMGVLSGVLPMDSAGTAFIEPAALATALQNPNVMRKETPLSRTEWAAICDFYLKNAPPRLEPSNVDIEQQLPLFEAKFPDHFLSPPSSVMVTMEKGSLFLGDVHSGRLYHFDEKLELESMAPVPGGAVCLNHIPEGDIVTSLGSFSPTDRPTGQVFFLPKAPGSQPVMLLDSLRRPVHTEVADLDGDGRFDLVTCEFAKWTGCLSWWKNDGKGRFEKHVLRNMPGAIRSYARDLNGDGLTDLIALFGQGDEGIFAFYNKGDGVFSEEHLLRFPPSYGSSFFTLFDYNGDGHDDIIYTCGDNADFPPIAKPYHGIRIYQNDGNQHFEEVFFYHLQGAYGAIPADFDLDGDLDIAAISFFPDFENRPEAGFVFLENDGHNTFSARTFPAVGKGRWIVMDAGDLDADGDLDLVLGSLAFEVVPDKKGWIKQWARDGIPFVLLENKAR